MRTRVQAVREIEHIDPIAIGDRVRYVEAGGGRGVITEVLPRRCKFSRPAPVWPLFIRNRNAGTKPRRCTSRD
jgi:hypothetical protein